MPGVPNQLDTSRPPSEASELPVVDALQFASQVLEQLDSQLNFDFSDDADSKIIPVEEAPCVFGETSMWYNDITFGFSGRSINHAELLRIPTSTLIQLANRAALVTGGALVGIGLSGEVDRKKCSARFFLKFQESLLEEILQSSPTVGIIVNTIDVHSF